MPVEAISLIEAVRETTKTLGELHRLSFGILSKIG
jgi:hypothetical protein